MFASVNMKVIGNERIWPFLSMYSNKQNECGVLHMQINYVNGI
jgi:hypothetical protein